MCSDHFKDGVGPTSQDRNKIPSENLPQKQKKILVRRDPPKRICRDTERADSSINTTEKAGILNHHSYSASVLVDLTPHEESSGSGNMSKETQTFSQSLVSVGIDINLPGIMIESIQHSNELMMFYTGMTDSNTFFAVFNSLMEQGADKLSTEVLGTTNNNKLGRKRKLRRVDEFLLVMMRLRLGLLLKDLEFRFKLSSSAVSKIFNSWILFYV